MTPPLPARPWSPRMADMSGRLRRLGHRAGVLATLPPILALLVAEGVQAQVPGYQQLDPGSVRAEYTAEVLDRINDHLADWGDAWANDRIEELTELYWEDAVMITPAGTTLRGQGDIRGYFESSLAEHGHIEAFMLDFDASGGMSQVFGNYMLGIQRGEDAGTQRSGPMLTVYQMRGRTWKIRSQVFLPQ